MVERSLTDLRKARRRATPSPPSALTSASVSASVVAAYLLVPAAVAAAAQLAPLQRLAWGAPCVPYAPSLCAAASARFSQYSRARSSVVKCSKGTRGEARRSIGSTLGDAHAKTSPPGSSCARRQHWKSTETAEESMAEQRSKSSSRERSRGSPAAASWRAWSRT